MTGGYPKDHTPGCCCLPCRRVAARANLARRLRLAPRHPVMVEEPTGRPRTHPAAESDFKRLTARVAAEQRREAALIARDIQDAQRELMDVPPPHPPPPRKEVPALTPIAAYRAARARGGIVLDPDLSERS